MTQEKLTFTSSLVTMLPLGSLGEGGVIPKSVILITIEPFTVSFASALAMVTGMAIGFFLPLMVRLPLLSQRVRVPLAAFTVSSLR